MEIAVDAHLYAMHPENDLWSWRGTIRPSTEHPEEDARLWALSRNQPGVLRPHGGRDGHFLTTGHPVGELRLEIKGGGVEPF